MSRDVLIKLAQVRRRLNLMHFLKIFSWALFASFLVACVVVLADKAFQFGLTLDILLASSLGGALVVAGAIFFCTRRTDLDAAMELDRAFGLKERVSTLLSISDNESAHAAIEALKADVERRTQKLIVAEKIPLQLPRIGLAPAIPFALLLAAFYLVGPLEWMQVASAKATTEKERKQIEAQTKVLSKKLAERKKEIAESALDEDLKELTAKLDEVSRELSENKKVGVKEAVVQLSDMAKAIENKKRDLDSLKMVKQNLSKLPNLQDGPGKDLAKALKQGDFKEAVKQLDMLQDALNKQDMNPEEKEKLAKQLDQLQKQLKQLANLEEREKQLRKSLPKEVAEKEIAKLREQAQQMKQLQELAEQLKQCSECMNSGGKDGEEDGEKMQAALDKAKQLVQELMQDEENAQMLETMLDDLAQCRAGMCQGLGEMPGEGMGRGQGAGDRPEKEDDTRSRKTRAQSELHQGPAFIVGKTEGKSFKGESSLEMRGAVAEAARAADEAVTRQKIPREYRDHTQDYFDKLNGELNQ